MCLHITSDVTPGRDGWPGIVGCLMASVEPCSIAGRCGCMLRGPREDLFSVGNIGAGSRGIAGRYEHLHVRELIQSSPHSLNFGYCPRRIEVNKLLRIKVHCNSLNLFLSGKCIGITMWCYLFDVFCSPRAYVCSPGRLIGVIAGAGCIMSPLADRSSVWYLTLWIVR